MQDRRGVLHRFLSVFRLPGWSLRSRLIAGFVAVILLTLSLVLVGLLIVLRQYQEQRETIRLGSLAGPLSFQVRTLEQQGAPVAEITEFLAREADEVDVRIVLARPTGLIFHDTEGSLVGHRIDLQSAPRFGPLRRARLARGQDSEDRRIFFLATAVGPQNARVAEQIGGRPSAYLVALVSDPQTIPRVLREIAPRLVVPTLLSLLASIGVAWLLAASIARPLAHVIRAAEAISRGQYGQPIPEGGAGEVGRLTRAFNTMAREVARSQQTLRAFVANVSHDLRTPLTSIQGFSRAMVDGSLRDRDDYAEAARIVHEEAERMHRLVEDLLELSAIELGQARLEFQPVDLAALASGVADRVERRAAEHGITVGRRILATPVVSADAGRLARLLDNLLDNAVKHTPTGGRITVTVGAERAPAVQPAASGFSNGSSATVSVYNTGSVILPDDLERIFERFYRVEKSRAGSGHHEGHGLGLSIAREIVQAHGGSIAARSSPDQGTELTITLPALDLRAWAGLGSTPVADVGAAARPRAAS